ncbi:uncharacterized protein OCT59_006649 [Rhizophagus irregularis]|uniref:uncharacterized protein n=1 Tax=Rhizophagus irregularis TaxID=588596 RepID=UPI003319C33A|nr:hypothetical protein OCT59_006649 [Rhizophagus irregularis]
MNGLNGSFRTAIWRKELSLLKRRVKWTSKRYGKERSLLSRFQNGDFSGFLRMQEVAEGMVRSFRTVMIKNRGKWECANEPSLGLEFVKEYWHSDLEFSCKGTCIRTWNSLAKRVG